MTTSYSVVRLGAKFPGRCVSCGSETGARAFELAVTILLKGGDGKYAVAHPRCLGLQTKNKIGGGVVMRSELPPTVEVAS